MIIRRGRQLFTLFAVALMTLAVALPVWSERAADAGASTIALTVPTSLLPGRSGSILRAGGGEHAPAAALPPAVMAQEGDAEFCFKEATGSPFSLGTRLPQSVAVGDFNLDGKPDLATANSGDNTVSVLLGDGAGGFTQAAGSPIDIDGYPDSVAVGDLNLDGKPDLAMVTPEYEGENVTVLLGDGAGGFKEPRESPFDAGDRVPQSLAVGDLNRDGNPDLAVGETFSALVVLLGDGTGNFTWGAGSPFPAGQSANSTVIGDFNLDQKPDVATANSDSNDVTVLLGNGAGSFTQAGGSPIGTSSSPQSLAITDFNLDGKLDLAVGSRTDTTVLLGDGAGGFAQPAGSPLPYGTNWVAVADFNLDDKPDLAASSQSGITILLGDGAGGFTELTGSPFGGGGRAMSVAVGDFNLDKKPDVTFADGFDVRVLLYSKECQPPPPPPQEPLQLTASAVTRAAGSPVANSQIATASGGEDPLNTLTVTVNGAASATADGVTVSNLAINAAGAVTANVVADCAAANASFSLRVTESKGQFAEATLNVGVTPDDIAPVITACATDKTFTADASCQAVIPDLRGEVAATDNCTPSSSLTITQSPAPGSLAGLGTTTVVISVRDAANNTSTCAAKVIVERGDACGALDPPIIDSKTGAPKQGYWALQPDPSLDPTGQRRAGRVRAQPPTRALSDFYNAVQPIVADFSSAQIDGSALFNFTILGGDGSESGPTLFPGDYHLNLTWLSGEPSSILFADANGRTLSNSFNVNQLKIVFLGNQSVELQALTPPSAGRRFEGFWLDRDSVFNWQAKPASAPYVTTKLLFRTYPYGADGSWSIDQLDEGEVALYQQCNYGGKVTVFPADSPDFAALTSGLITLDKTAASVKLGPNTSVTLYPERDFAGAGQFIESDTACLDGTSIGRNTTSIKIRSLVATLLETRSCVNCNLRGVDLRGQDLSGVDLTGADLTGANLTGASLRGASLAGTKFENATLGCADFSGTAARPADLTQTNFQNARVTQDFSCRANFTYTRVDTEDLETQLRYLDLSHATLVFRVGVEFLDMSNALLVGASIQNADILGVNLTGANLTGANLTGTEISYDGEGNTPGNLRNAILDGVTGLAGTYLGEVVFSGAKLRGVDLSRATLDGASFEGADLTGANLTGVALPKIDLQGAILDKVIGLAGVDLSRLVLEGVSLQGTDLSHVVLNGTQLNKANLTGANLTGVSLSNAILAGATLDQVTGLAGTDQSQVVLNGVSLRQVDLSNAKLYGATLDAANLEGSNLSGAFLTNNEGGGVAAAASLAGARLKNVNFSNAQLSGANFTNANFYGSVALGEKTCDINAQGFTVDCATASGATMNNAQFSGAYLYGVDFTNTTIQGVQFGNAVLVGTNFTGATLSTDPTVGTESGFDAAFLQGAHLAGATLTNISLRNAFVDFRQEGNDMYLRLDGTHTVFAGWKTPGEQVCVFAYYTGPTTVPTTNTTLTCPDGAAAGASGCGPAEASNLRWKSPVEIDQTNPPASYLEDATYTKRAEKPICSDLSADW